MAPGAPLHLPRPNPPRPPRPSNPPPRKHVDTSAQTAISRLLHAIALKEAATARLIHVEVEKAERAAREAIGALSYEDVLALHRSAADMVYALARKEEQTVSKLNVLLGIVETMAGIRKADEDEDGEQDRSSYLFHGDSRSDDES